MTKETKILLDATLKRPPLLKNGKFFRIYLPKRVILETNVPKQVDLKFKIKILENVNNQIVMSPDFREQLIEVHHAQF